MKKKLIEWLLKQLQPTYTKEQKEQINRFKHYLRFHFEGFDEYKPTEPILIKNFEITDFQYKFEGNFLTVTVYLVRPGIFIGKGGRTIKALNEYLSNIDCKVDIRESKLWSYIR
jgi:hypothetical protein